MSFLSVKDLSFTYPDGRAALDGVSFDIEQGEFVCVCGLSGCGKSTLLRLIKTGLAPHGRRQGDVLYRGESVFSMDAARATQDTGFVMQDPDSQIVTDKVWHELAFSLESAGLPTAEMRRRVSEMACYFDLEDVFEKDCASLSGGQKQLLALASAAAMHPKLLLLDEPSSQLDPIAANSFIDALARLNRDFGMTVLIAEHRLEELLHIADRVLVMDKGRLIADCRPREICGHLSASHPMMQAMPLSVQLYAKGGGSDNAPLTLREARANAECGKALAAFEKTAREATKSGEPLIVARQLRAGYTKASRDVLVSTDITVKSGSIYAVLGGNGSGKSTLLKCLCGILKPFGGSIKRGKGITCGYLPQNPCAIFTEDTVQAELAATGEDYTAAAQRFSLGELFDSHPYDLSGGEQQRLALAKLMLKKPDVLLLDEPTKGMDAAARAEFCRLLRGLADEGTAAVLVTHDVQLAEDCADICGLLFNGEMTTEAPPEEFFRSNYFYTTPLARLMRERDIT